MDEGGGKARRRERKRVMENERRRKRRWDGEEKGRSGGKWATFTPRRNRNEAVTSQELESNGFWSP